MSMTKCTWGGRRKGSGRKPTRGKLINLRVSPDEHRELKAEAKRRGVTVSDLLMRPWRKGV
jgi:predicted HicB family RNase H-like nuclease